MGKSYNKNYSDTENHTGLFNLLQNGECITVCGLPYSGKSRLVKHALTEQGKIDQTAFLRIPQSHDQIDFIEEVNKLYKKGSRTFVAQYVDLDDKDSLKYLRDLCIFRQSKVDLPQLIFFLNGDPYSYYSELQNCRVIFNNVYYIDISNPESQQFFIKQNSDRFSAELSKQQKGQVLSLSGGNPLLIKELIKALSEGRDITELDEESPINYFVRIILDELSEKDLDGIRKVVYGKKIEQRLLNHLKSVGIVENGALTSELIRKGLKNYKREYELHYFQGELIVKGRSVSKEFTNFEREFLRIIIQNKSINRDDVSALLQEDRGDIPSEAVIDKSISRMRNKLSALGIREGLIVTRRGIGYELDQSIV